MMQPHPRADQYRENRVIYDVAALLHESPLELSEDDKTLTINAGVKKKIQRWIGHVLTDAASRGRWWFLENVAPFTLNSGQDVIDLKGHVDRVAAFYAPKRLTLMSLAEMTHKRMTAAAEALPNAGVVTHYAIEAGRRLHTWPCTNKTINCAVLYSRPMHIAIVPDEWERILLNGVLGMFGRHFDRDALTADPEDFEARYERALTRAAVCHHDIEQARRWDDIPEAQVTVSASSATDTAVGKVVPASLTGVGFVTVETGDYPLAVVP